MLLSEGGTVLVLAPHADDEVLGCGGLMASLARRGVGVHVLYASVDGSRHYGLAGTTTFAERVAEIEEVSRLLGFTYEIAYPEKGLMMELDTLPRRELVDLYQHAMDERRPDVVLLPSGADYDHDHVTVFLAGFAAARPIPEQFGKRLVPHVLAYEMTKIQWAAEPLPRSTAYHELTGEDLETKQRAIALYRTQARVSPHIRSPESVAALAVVRGAEVGVPHAEAYQVLRTLI
ncbi:PIG-L deacetylase family protein [Cellulomonas aerilata]|uniref:PIG-L domain-containing protein n=1 Tax=Cellulomonas aerilata TaxID=515326 RepID=A0A512D931_9CELL|nr:PIG-L family deacetylase [Cellulomonas aerilata]GEO32979.1 PIG-L domain-containing protein [Cellulomonas aerilata]